MATGNRNSRSKTGCHGFVRFFVPALALALLGSLQAQPTIVGDWQATLRAGADEIHLTLHISQGDGDNLKASMDSAEQGARGVLVTSMSFANAKLDFMVDSVHATYTGTFNPATGAIDGVWSQGQPTPLTFVRVVRSRPAVRDTSLDGTWQGTLQIGGYQLPILFHIVTTREGLTATMDSPEQGATAVPVISVRKEGDTLTLQLPNIGAKYQGTIDENESAIEGTFTQGGASVPLSLKRTDAKRSQ